MAQATLGSFEQEKSVIRTKPQVMVLILKDLNAAWTDRNWYLHSQDILFLDYEPTTGTWTDGAEEVIDSILRSAFPDNATRYLKDETIAHIKGSHYVFSEFTEKEGIYVNCQNGVLDISNMKLLPHSPDYYFRHVLPVRFKPRAKCPNVLKFIGEVPDDE
ncbi:MAG: hypothetical protein M1476_06715 [Candidatus Thermoplasmatota archaeon]|nr:hypothetical protein [Candidatus Thermoplasmatota archaeon]